MVKLDKGTHKVKLELVKKCGFLGVEIGAGGKRKAERVTKSCLCYSSLVP
jgi:hypothetical protein